VNGCLRRAEETTTWLLEPEIAAAGVIAGGARVIGVRWRRGAEVDGRTDAMRWTGARVRARILPSPDSGYGFVEGLVEMAKRAAWPGPARAR
jgi:hypothetical protein